MTTKEAESVIKEVDGKNYSWLKAWGLSTIKEAIYTIRIRKKASEEIKELAESVNNKILDPW